MEDIPLCLIIHKLRKLFIFAIKHNGMLTLPYFNNHHNRAN